MKHLPRSAILTGLAGIVLFLLGDLYTSFGFLVCALGGLVLLWAWLLALRHFCRSEQEKTQRIAKIVKKITFTALFLGILSFLVIESLIIGHSAGTADPDANTLIVLGAGLHGEVPSATLASRLEVALDYLQAHPDAVAVLTGGQGPHETVTEASAMAKWLTYRGIDPQRLYLEEQASNTVQNLAYSKAIVDELALPGPIALVSNGFHLFRAEILAENTGFVKVQTLSAPVPQAWLYPSVYLREYCSVLLMIARDLF